MTTVQCLPIDKVLIERAVALGGYDVHILSGRTPKEVQIMQPLANPVIKHYSHGDAIERVPAFQLDHQGAQALIDALWTAGVRPSSGMGAPADAQLVKAMQAHIDDLRLVAQLKQSPDMPTGQKAAPF